MKALQASRWDSALAATQPGTELPGYYHSFLRTDRESDLGRDLVKGQDADSVRGAMEGSGGEVEKERADGKARGL